MKKITLLLGSLMLCFIFSTNMNAQSKSAGTKEAMDNLKPYPTTIDNLERHVIFLEKQANEDIFKIELIAGKTMMVDCNIHRLAGSFKEETLQGWGYNYYVFNTNNMTTSTLMACPDNTKTEKFVSGQSLTVRYNSRLPIVVYLPKGVELKYKIWIAGPETSVVKE